MNLITWNVQWCLGADGVLDPVRIIDHARAMADFDVLCLQEVADNFPELDKAPAGNQFRQIADLLPGSRLSRAWRLKRAMRKVSPSGSAT